VLRIERDRKGVIRVFSGAKLSRPVPEAGATPAQASDISEQPLATDAFNEREAAVQVEFQPIGQDEDIPGNVVDTTAEALSQAQGGSAASHSTRARRARKTTAVARTAPRKAGPRTAAPRKRREPPLIE
jgi:hypothetical protein